eukprot:4269385-Pleurochrysis_carterae.AAC.1
MAKPCSFVLNEHLPLATLADLKLFFGNTASPAAMSSPAADRHLAAERLRAALLSTLRVSAASDVL